MKVRSWSRNEALLQQATLSQRQLNGYEGGDQARAAEVPNLFRIYSMNVRHTPKKKKSYLSEVNPF